MEWEPVVDILDKLATETASQILFAHQLLYMTLFCVLGIVALISRSVMRESDKTGAEEVKVVWSVVFLLSWLMFLAFGPFCIYEIFKAWLCPNVVVWEYFF